MYSLSWLIPWIQSDTAGISIVRRFSSGVSVALLLAVLTPAHPAAAADDPEDQVAESLFATAPDVTRLIVGFEQAAASAAESEWKYFIDFTIDVGFGRKDKLARGAYGPIFRTW